MVVMVDALCLGELLIDFVSTANGVTLAEAPGFIKAPGGAPANVAVAMRRQGLASAFIGKVGDDPFGHFLRSVLANEGVDVGGIILDPGAKTTLAFVSLTREGERDFAFYRDPGADSLLRSGEIDRGAVQAAIIFHFGSVSLSREPSRSATLAAAREARKAGRIVSYDPNLRPPLWPSLETARKEILGAMGFAHILKVNEEELAFLMGTDPPDPTSKDYLAAGAEFLLGLGPELVVVTLGPGGCYFDNGNARGWFPAYPVKAVDTTGAGDTFVGVMLSRLLPYFKEGVMPSHLGVTCLENAVKFANAAGALTTLKKGGIPALPTINEVRAFALSSSPQC